MTGADGGHLGMPAAPESNIGESSDMNNYFQELRWSLPFFCNLTDQQDGLETSEFFWERALLDQEKIRTANALTLTDLRLLVIPIDTFRSFIHRFPSLRENFRQIFLNLI
jgi:CRP-like cAMP-binding protein